MEQIERFLSRLGPVRGNISGFFSAVSIFGHMLEAVVKRPRTRASFAL